MSEHYAIVKHKTRIQVIDDLDSDLRNLPIIRCKCTAYARLAEIRVEVIINDDIDKKLKESMNMSGLI